MQRALSVTKLPAGTVTFLMSDIEGSTKLLSRLQEEYANLLEAHHQLLRGIFSRWHGQVLGTEGDSFFVVFPRAKDALSAAAEVQKAIASYPWPGGVQVRLRMGMHTGDPWLRADDYVGMDLHRTARIAHVGHGGQVLLSETTAAIVRDSLPEGLRLRDLGRYSLKDMEQPVAITLLLIEGLPDNYQPLQANMVEAAPSIKTTLQLPVFLTESRVEPASPLFVAREEELDWLHARFEEACAGQGRISFVTGEAGVGKTALLEAFMLRAQDQCPDLLVAFGQCHAYAGMGDPYLPFRQVMDMLCGDLEGRYVSGRINRRHALRIWQSLPDNAAALSEWGPNLFGVFVDGNKLVERLVVAGNTKQGQEVREQMVRKGGNLWQSQLFEQYGKVLGAIAGQRPLLLVLDDLQWTDDGSANLLFHLVRALSGYPVFILGAYRPEEITGSNQRQRRHALAKPLAEFRRTYGDVWLRLDQMDDRARRAFVDAVIDSEPNQLSESFHSALYHHTEGHALFTVELLHSLQTHGGLIYEENQGWVESTTLNWQGIPARVEGVIAERVNAIDQDLREILVVAAVEGERFTAQLLAQVLDWDEHKLIRRLASALIRHHSIIADDGQVEVNGLRLFRFRFRHTLFHQYVYDQLTDSEKATLHLKVGQAMQELFHESVDDVAVQLYQHFDRAGDDARALRYAFIAGTRARRLGAGKEALDLYDAALAKTAGVHSPVPDIPVHRIHERLGDVYFEYLSRHDEAYTHYTAFFEMADDESDRARAERKLAGIDMVQGKLDRAQERCESALALLGDRSSDIESCRIHSALAYLLLSQNKLTLADQHARTAMHLAEQTEDARTLGDAHRILGILANFRDALDEACAYSLTSLEYYSQVGDIPQVTHAYNNIGDNCRLLGRMQEAIAYLEKGIELACRMGDTRDEALLLLTLAEVFMDQGRWKDAIELLSQRALPLAEESGASMRAIMAHRLMGVVYEQTGDLDRSERHLLNAEQIMIETGYHRFAADIYLELAHLCATQGAFSSAEAYLEQVQDFAGDAPTDRLLRETQLCMAYILACGGKWAEAVLAFEAGVQALARAGSVADEAKARLQLAQAYLQNQDASDVNRACQQLHLASRAFNDIAATAYLVHVQQVMASLQCPED